MRVESVSANRQVRASGLPKVRTQDRKSRPEPKLDRYERGFLPKSGNGSVAIRNQETRNQVRRRKLQLDNPDFKKQTPVVNTRLSVRVENGKTRVAAGSTSTVYIPVSGEKNSRGRIVDTKA